MIRVLLPGSFDPPTNGHLDLIERSVRIFDKIEVVISQNMHKQYTFNAEERLDMMSRLCTRWESVDVHIWDKMIVEFARMIDASIMIRGVRALSDFSYEFELSMLNKGLNPDIETMFLPTAAQYFVLRSSAIKELVRLGGDVSTMVPPLVEERLRERLAVEPVGATSVEGRG